MKARQRLSGEIGLARGLDRAEVDAWIDCGPEVSEATEATASVADRIAKGLVAIQSEEAAMQLRRQLSARYNIEVVGPPVEAR